jgi:hypothetical protein
MSKREDPTTEQVVPDDGPLLRDPPPPPGWVDPLDGSDPLDQLLAEESTE